jgi:branched-chain amino acid transport system substrate-binding protein
LRLIKVIYFCFVITLIGCSLNGSGSSDQDVALPPWVLLESADPELSYGDEAFLDGDLKEATQEYQKLLLNDEVSRRLLLKARERIAMVYILQDNGKEALKLLTEYFRTEQIPASKVGGVPALLLGEAYWSEKNINQAIAWLARAARSSGSVSTSSRVANSELVKVLGSLREEQLRNVEFDWREDTFISSFIIKERHRRLNNSSVNPSFEIEETDISGDPIIVGGVNSGVNNATVLALLPLSGSYGALGGATKNGIELGLRGTGLGVKFIDTQSISVPIATLVESELKNGNVAAIVGPLIADSVEAVATVARQNRIPMMHFSKQDLAPKGNGVFRLGITNQSQMNSLIEEVSDRLGIREVGIIRPNTELGTQLADVFASNAQAKGVTIKFDLPINPADIASLTQLASDIESSNISAIFYPGDVKDVVQLQMGFSEPFRSKVILLGPATWYVPEKLKNLQKVLDGAIFVAPFVEDKEDLAVQQFVANYNQDFKESPNLLAAQGFDAARLVAVATNNGSMLNGLSQIDQFKGVTGSISSDGSGEMMRKMSVVQFKDGRVKDLTVPKFIERSNNEFTTTE